VPALAIVQYTSVTDSVTQIYFYYFFPARPRAVSLVLASTYAGKSGAVDKVADGLDLGQVVVGLGLGRGRGVAGRRGMLYDEGVLVDALDVEDLSAFEFAVQEYLFFFGFLVFFCRIGGPTSES
jgi:hypothetical protein